MPVSSVKCSYSNKKVFLVFFLYSHSFASGKGLASVLAKVISETENTER